MPRDRVLPLEMLGAALAVVLACGAAALVHQARASAEAEAVGERGGSPMIQVRHLARCVSFSMPIAGSTAEDCLERGEAVISALRADGREEDARVASSALYGAIQSSFWETPALRAAKRSLGAAMLPVGATPVRMGSVRPAEPWGFVGTVAGGLLVLLMVRRFVLQPLLRRPPRRRAWLREALTWAALLILFIMGLLRA
jgi:hypothetical protein